MSAGAQASRTAEAVAWLRAAGALEEDERVRNPDHLARGLLKPGFAALGRVPGAWRLALRLFEGLAPGYYEYELARTRQIDRILLNELAGGLDQLVLLGSGYDSRPYRFADQLTGVRTFEIDREATLTQKRQRVSKRGYDTSGVAYVALDLSGDSPLRALHEHDYDMTARTLFLCSGVMMYLDATAAERVLAFVARSGERSSICFDYVYATALEAPAAHYGAGRMIRYVKWQGEPYRFALDPADLPTFLARNGLRLLSDAGPRELERDHLRLADGTLRGRVCGYLGIAHAGRAPV